MLPCSICCSIGLPMKWCAIAFWSTTRRDFTASNERVASALPRRHLQAQIGWMHREAHHFIYALAGVREIEAVQCGRERHFRFQHREVAAWTEARSGAEGND